jgi:hypothetical protein
MATSPIAFLFNADHPGRPCSYGDIFDRAFLRGLSVSDPVGRTYSSVLRGSVLLRKLATVTEPILFEGRYPATRESLDPCMFAALVRDFVEDLRIQWHTIDLCALGGVFVRHNIHCLSLLSLAPGLNEGIDCCLRDTAGYLGAVEIDLGHPIQRFAFAGCLLEDAVILSGEMLLEVDDEGEHVEFEGADSFEPGGRRWVTAEEMATLRPHLVWPGRSERGREVVERYKKQLRGADASLH